MKRKRKKRISDGVVFPKENILDYIERDIYCRCCGLNDRIRVKVKDKSIPCPGCGFEIILTTGY